jgi:hypothetical protein
MSARDLYRQWSDQKYNDFKKQKDANDFLSQQNAINNEDALLANDPAFNPSLQQAQDIQNTDNILSQSPPSFNGGPSNVLDVIKRIVDPAIPYVEKGLDVAGRTVSSVTNMIDKFGVPDVSQIGKGNPFTAPFTDASQALIQGYNDPNSTVLGKQDAAWRGLVGNSLDPRGPLQDPIKSITEGWNNPESAPDYRNIFNDFFTGGKDVPYLSGIGGFAAGISNPVNRVAIEAPKETLLNQFKKPVEESINNPIDLPMEAPKTANTPNPIDLQKQPPINLDFAIPGQPKVRTGIDLSGFNGDLQLNKSLLNDFPLATPEQPPARFLQQDTSSPVIQQLTDNGLTGTKKVQNMPLYRGDMFDTNGEIGQNLNIARPQSMGEVVGGTIENNLKRLEGFAQKHQQELIDAQNELQAIRNRESQGVFDYQDQQKKPLLRTQMDQAKLNIEGRLKQIEDLKQSIKAEEEQSQLANNDLLYVTSQRATAENYANQREGEGAKALFGELPANYKPTIHEFTGNFNHVLDLSKIEHGFFDVPKAHQLLQEIGVPRDKWDEVISNTSLDEMTGRHGNVFQLFRGKNLPIIMNAIKHKGYDAIHFAEGIEDNWISLDKTKLKQGSPNNFKRLPEVKGKLNTDNLFPYQNEFNQSVNEEFNRLKQIRNNPPKPLDRGGLIKDNEGYVQGGYKTTSGKPDWLLNFERMNGRMPRNEELMKIARDNLMHGEKDSRFGDLPAWKPKDAQELESSIQEIKSMIPEADPVTKESLVNTLSELQKEHDAIVQRANIETQPIESAPQKPNFSAPVRPLDKKTKRTIKGIDDLISSLQKPQEAPKDVQGFFGKNVLPNASQSTGTITRKQVVDNIKKNIGATIRTGRLDVKNALGIFKVQPEVIRSAADKDLVTISHEVGHYLDKKFNLQSDPALHNELTQIAQPLVRGNKAYTAAQHVEEGIAEFVRRYLTEDHAQLKQDAPGFYKFFTEKLPKDVVKGLESSRKDVQTWINQGLENQFRSKINRTGKDKSYTGLSDRINRIYTQFMDAANPFAVAEKDINLMQGKKGFNSAEDSLYKKARLYAGTPRIAEQKLQGLEHIIKPLEKIGIKADDLGDYSAAIHARNLEQQGIKSGFTKAEIDATINKFKSPEMDAAQKSLVKYSNELLDMLVKSGRISQDAVNAMKAKHPDYVPFYRYFDEDLNASQGMGKGFANVTNPIKRLEGSTRDIIDPIESLVKNTFAVVNAAKKNEVGLELLKLSNVDGSGKWIERVRGDKSAKENVVTVYDKGQPVHLQLDPELYRATLNMDKEVSNSFVRLLSTFASSLRAGATLTPEFILRNPIRDQFHAYIVSKNGYKPLIDLPKGIFHMLKKDDIYKQWIENGGAHGQYVSQDRDVLRKELKKLQSNPSAFKALNVVNPKQWLEIMRKLSEMSEEGTKVGEFNRGLKQGLSPQEAAFRSRDIMDFSRVGNSVQQTNRIVAFLNANMQGKDVLIRSFKDNPWKTSVRAVSSLTFPAMAAYMWSSGTLGNIGLTMFERTDEQKKLYEAIPQWQKDNFFIVPIPFTNEFARIPKPFDLAPMFTNLPEQIFRYMSNNHPQEWSKFALNFAKDSAAIPMMLTGLTPIIENLANYSFFRDAPIVPQRDLDLQPKDQYGPKTSLTARAIGNATNTSPYKVDNLIRGYGAGLSGYGTAGVDKLIESTGLMKKPPEEESKWKGIPLPDTLINAFTAQTTGSTKTMNDFYDLLDEVSKQKNSAKKNGTKFNEAEYRMLDHTNDQISKARTKYRGIQGDLKMTPEQKRQNLDKLDELMNTLAEQALNKHNKK